MTRVDSKWSNNNDHSNGFWKTILRKPRIVNWNALSWVPFIRSPLTVYISVGFEPIHSHSVEILSHCRPISFPSIVKIRIIVVKWMKRNCIGTRYNTTDQLSKGAFHCYKTRCVKKIIQKIGSQTVKAQYKWLVNGDPSVSHSMIRIVGLDNRRVSGNITGAFLLWFEFSLRNMDHSLWFIGIKCIP